MNRKMLLRASTIAVIAVSALAFAPGLSQAQKAYDPAIETQTTIADGFTYAVVGDIIYPLPFSKLADPAFQEVFKPLKSADVAYGNLEMAIVDMDDFRPGPAMYFMGVPEIAADLKALGFDAMGRANNHLYDYGAEGMIETNDHLEKVGIVYAGSGKTYAAAHAPRYLMTEKGRVAFVASSTSMSPTYTSLPTIVRATLPDGEAPGRPGVAQIATTQVFLVPRTMAPTLEAMKKAFPTGGALYAPPDDRPERFSVMGQVFKYGDVARPEFTYEVSQSDVQAALRSIREGKIKSDFLSYGLHTHETQYPDKPDTDPIPGDFLQGFAHQVIDAGADTFVGTGVHVLRGIEIYKGRPIFYGLGEFFRQMDINRPSGQAPQRGDVNSDPQKYESVIAVNRFEGGQLAEVRIYPVELGGDRRMAHRGVPRMPSGEAAQRILKRLQELSAPYGTTIAIRNNVGIITLAAAKPRARP